MDPAILVTLVAASLLIGATGTWSPCGFSMVETIGPQGHTGGRPTTLAACATFLPGAIAGALATFGGLALLGGLIPGDGGWVSYTVAMVVALLAAAAEARGARIAPQIRRQLPEHWRRVMPMPLAAALYGVLLGLGFTTFVLTFGVWALAGIALALGEPAAGIAIGLGFGVGRAVPVVALAPVADRPFGLRAITLMAERPGLYRAIRLGDAFALVLAAGALLFAGTAQAQEPEPEPPAAPPTAADEASATQDAEEPAALTPPATEEAQPTAVRGVPQGLDTASDPSTFGLNQLAYSDGPDDKAMYDDGSGSVAVPGLTDPAIGGPNLLVGIDGDRVEIYNRNTLTEIDSFKTKGADAVAIEKKWVAYRVRKKGDDSLWWKRLKANGKVKSKRKLLAKANKPGQVGIPSMTGKRVVFAVARRNANKIMLKKRGEQRKTVLSTKLSGVSNPSVRGAKMLFVLNKRSNDELRLKRIGSGGFGSKVTQRPRLWSTSLTKKRAYFTVLTGSDGSSKIRSKTR